MKQKLMLLLALVCAGVASAQVRFGVEAGGNLTRGIDDHSVAKPGFTIGATAEGTISGNWIWETALRLSTLNFKSDYTSQMVNSRGDQFTRNIHEYTPTYLMVPVRAGYRFNLLPNFKLSVTGGLVGGVGLFGHGKHTYHSSSTDYHAVTDVNKIFDRNSPDSFSTSRFTYGVTARVGADIGSNFTVGLDYTLNHIPGKFTVTDNLATAALTLGYRF